jgi:hypothetical protein
MKSSLHLLTVSLALCAGAASAEPFHIRTLQDNNTSVRSASPIDAQAQAQFLAERHMWRLAGMQQLNARQRAEQIGVPYESAKARYDALIASSEFPVLVGALTRDPGLEVRFR